jgi:hypothetical protein
MRGFTAPRLARVGLAILLLIVVRSLAEFFRLKYAHGDSLTIAQVTPFVVGALTATLALALAAIWHAADFHRASIATTLAAIIGLLTYKIVAIG